MKPAREPSENAGSALLARLRRMPKRYWLLVLLLPLLLVLWLPLITGKKRNRGAAPTASPTEPTADATPSAPAVETAPSAKTNPIAAAVALDERLQRLTVAYEPRWSAAADPSPFRTPVVVTAETVADADTALVPTSIVLSTGQPPFAIIGGRIYRPGDSIDGRSILAIEERRVLFREGNKTYAVSLPEPTLRGDHD